MVARSTAWPFLVRPLLLSSSLAGVWLALEKMPAPTAYLKCTVALPTERILPTDPRAEIRLRNVGSVPMHIESVHFEVQRKSAAWEAVTLENVAGGKLASFNFSRAPIGLVGLFASNARITLGTFRPADDALAKGSEWCEDLKHDLRNVRLVVKYRIVMGPVTIPHTFRKCILLIPVEP